MSSKSEIIPEKIRLYTSHGSCVAYNGDSKSIYGKQDKRLSGYHQETRENKPMYGCTIVSINEDAVCISIDINITYHIGLSNFQRMLPYINITSGLITTGLVFTTQQSTSALTSVESPEYKELMQTTKLNEQKLNIRDVKVGSTVMLVNGQEHLFLGKMMQNGRERYISKNISLAENKNQMFTIGTKIEIAKVISEPSASFNFEDAIREVNAKSSNTLEFGSEKDGFEGMEFDCIVPKSMKPKGNHRHVIVVGEAANQSYSSDSYVVVYNPKLQIAINIPYMHNKDEFFKQAKAGTFTLPTQHNHVGSSFSIAGCRIFYIDSDIEIHTPVAGFSILPARLEMTMNIQRRTNSYSYYNSFSYSGLDLSIFGMEGEIKGGTNDSEYLKSHSLDILSTIAGWLASGDGIVCQHAKCQDVGDIVSLLY